MDNPADFMAAAARKIGIRIAEFKDECVKAAIVAAGYEPEAAEDAEWRQHIVLVSGGETDNIYLDGQPLARITLNTETYSVELEWTCT